MNCPDGSQKKASAPDYGWITVADEMCALYGQDSWMCQMARSNLSSVIGNQLVDVNQLCSSNPSPPNSLTVVDFMGTGWVSKALDLAKAKKWQEWCEFDTPHA